MWNLLWAAGGLFVFGYVTGRNAAKDQAARQLSRLTRRR